MLHRLNNLHMSQRPLRHRTAHPQSPSQTLFKNSRYVPKTPHYSLLTPLSNSPTKLSYISRILYCASLGVTKASLLLQLIRLSPLPSKRLQKIILIVLVTSDGVVSYRIKPHHMTARSRQTSRAVAVVFSSIFNCTPPSYSWEQFDTKKDAKGMLLRAC